MQKIEILFLVEWYLLKQTDTSQTIRINRTNQNFPIMSKFATTLTESIQTQFDTVVRTLANHYGFDASEATRFLNDVDFDKPVVVSQTKTVAPQPMLSAVDENKAKEKKEKKAVQRTTKAMKPKCPFPWTGVVIDTWCQGLRPNHGMLSQCIQAPKSDGFCNTCFKQFQTNGKTKCGTVTDRLNADKEGVVYKNPDTGKAPVKAGSILKKLKMTKEEIIEEAAKFGIVIPEDEFVTTKKAKGRPPASKSKSKGEDKLDAMIARAVSAVSSSSESEDDGAKSSGAEVPVKEATPEAVKEATPEAVKEATPEAVKEDTTENSTNGATPELKEETIVYEAETVETVETVNVKKFHHGGKDYLIDPSDNILYDPETQDAVGVWNPQTKTVDDCELVTDDEDEDDE